MDLFLKRLVRESAVFNLQLASDVENKFYYLRYSLFFTSQNEQEWVTIWRKLKFTTNRHSVKEGQNSASSTPVV